MGDKKLENDGPLVISVVDNNKAVFIQPVK
jgi:hypothetical protein